MAAKRDVKDITRGDLGRGTGDDQGQQAKFRDILLSLVPTALVAPYTFLITLIAGAVDDPTAKVPNPNNYAVWRWITFAFIMALTMAAVIKGYIDKRTPTPPRRKFPVAEFIGAVVATAAWGLSIPESPLVAVVSGKAKYVAPAAVLAAAAAVIGVLFPTLKKQVVT